MGNSSISAQKEKFLRDLQLSAKLFKPLLIIGLLSIVLAVFIFSSNDMVYTTSGFLGIPTINYTGAFWTSWAIFIFGMVCFIIAFNFRSAKADYKRVSLMTDEEFVSYRNKQKVKAVAKILFKLFGA